MSGHVMEEPDNPHRIHSPETEQDDAAGETLAPPGGMRPAGPADETFAPRRKHGEDEGERDE